MTRWHVTLVSAIQSVMIGVSLEPDNLIQFLETREQPILDIKYIKYI
jgi:hypothetical protein